MKKIILLLIILIFAQNIVSSAIMFDPELEWKSIKTEHFWIHYHQGLENEAKRLSVIAEKVHNLLKDEIKWEPALRTDVVLVDNMYTANGFAMPLPFNRIQIYLTRPEPDSVLNNYDDWMELVFLHEYVHILNMDTVYGFPAVLRRVLGRLYSPNIFLPIWMLEGNAVYHESAYSKYGRNNSTYTDMVIRTEVFFNNLKTIGDASHFPREWPTGRVPYLYGGLFVEFLEKKYGNGSMAEVFIGNSNNALPYSDHVIPYLYLDKIMPFLRSSDEYVYGESFDGLWDEWQEYTKLKYNNQISKIKEASVTSYKQITKSGYNTSLPRFSRDGESLFFIRLTNYNEPELMKYSLKIKELTELCRVNNPNSITTSNNGDIFLSDAEYYRSFSIYNEAFKFDNDDYEKLTSRLRCGYIDISKNGDKAVFVKKDRDRYSIMLSNLEFSKFDIILKDSDIQFAFTRFSPDGNSIAFTLKDRESNADIAILNMEENKVIRLSIDEFNDIGPAWHPDGTKIIFSSDRSGVYNLYEYNLENNTISKITNLIGGAFAPDISPDGKTIAFSIYNKNGFDISTMKYPAEFLCSEESNPQDIAFDYFKTEEDKTQVDGEIKSENYNLLNSAFPSFWMPVYASQEVYEDKFQSIFGVFTLGTDTLFQHAYMLNLYAYTFEKRANIDIYYMISKFYPDIIFEYLNDTLFFGNDKFPWENKNLYSLKRTMEQSGTAGIAFPFIYSQSYHYFSFSYKLQKSYEDYYVPPGNTFRDIDKLARLRGKYHFSNTEYYSYSISNEDGRIFYLISDIYNKSIGSDITLCKIRGEYAEYLPGIGRNNVIMLRGRGGAAFNNPSNYVPYNLGRFEKGETGAPKTSEDEFGLRGYPSGLIYGTRLATGTFEYRFPIIQPDLSYGTLPLMLRDIWINLFFDYGNVWEGEAVLYDFNSSAGVELNMRITAGYNVNFSGYIGYAKGFNEYGEHQVYFAVSTIFEGAFKNNYKWLDYL